MSYNDFNRDGEPRYDHGASGVLGQAANWLRAIVLITATLLVVWALMGRDLITDVQDVVTAVLSSGQPVGVVVPPCVTEYSPGPCYWNAPERGNLTGNSFTVDGVGNVTYWED
jgi:hypothetical protein